MGSETETGGWADWYATGLVIGGDGDPAMLFGQNKKSHWCFLQQISPEGKMGHQVYHSQWKYYYDTATSFVVDGESYLFGQSSSSNRWFIQELPRGQMGGQTDDGKWEFYYDTAAPFYVNGKTFLFVQKKSTNYWNINEVHSGGKMGSEIDHGTWSHYYSFIFPMLVDSDYLSTYKWMTDNFDLIKDRHLNEIAIPGSHDAGMSTVQKHNHHYGNSCNTQTQISDIGDQLLDGARFLDLRPVWLNNEKEQTAEWSMGHWGKVEVYGYVGSQGQTLDNTVGDIRSYLALMKKMDSKHKELVILNFSHCYSIALKWNSVDEVYEWSGRPCNDTEWREMIDKSLEALSEFMLDVPANCGDYPYHILSCSYEYLMRGGGHVIFLVDHDSIPTGYAKGVVNVADFRIYNDYSDTETFSDMREDQYYKLCTEQKENELFLLSWTLTLSGKHALDCLGAGEHLSILKLAINADNNLMRWVMRWVMDGDITKTYFPNIVYVDRFGSFATRAAIYLNKNYADLNP